MIQLDDNNKENIKKTKVKLFYTHNIYIILIFFLTYLDMEIIYKEKRKVLIF